MTPTPNECDRGGVDITQVLIIVLVVLLIIYIVNRI